MKKTLDMFAYKNEEYHWRIQKEYTIYILSYGRLRLEIMKKTDLACRNKLYAFQFFQESFNINAPWFKTFGYPDGLESQFDVEIARYL